jgi:hypothetical protein
LTLEEQIENLIEKSLNDKKFIDSIFFDLPIRAQQELKKILFKDFSGYVCEINSHDIRHSNKNHSQDVKYIVKVPDIVLNFNEIKKSFVEDEITGKTIHAVEFYKKYEGDIVKVVKIHLRSDKKLRLKTIFIPN